MRELKFRVFDLAIPKDMREAEDDKASGDMVNWEYVKKSSYLINGLNGKYPIMQFTGLKDCNDTEIYECDIVAKFDFQDTYFRSVVVFHRGAFGYWSLRDFISFASNYSFEWVNGKSNKIKVIGNSFINPELVEAK